MPATIIGMIWNKNEGDILREIIEAALPKVDVLYIADDGSTDNSWKIIRDLFFERRPKIEHIQREPNPRDAGQRTALLNKIKERYNATDAWVQVIESDIMILDTDVREAIQKYNVQDICVSWHALNACRKPGTWEEIDTYPNWERPIKELMPFGHYMEPMLYTFRPLPKLEYEEIWRPWPHGFNHYVKGKAKHKSKKEDSPLLAHYGFRGPTHFRKKYSHMGSAHRKYPAWKLTSNSAVLESVSFFNGDWNTNPHDMSREGWKEWLRTQG